MATPQRRHIHMPPHACLCIGHSRRLHGHRGLYWSCGNRAHGKADGCASSFPHAATAVQSPGWPVGTMLSDVQRPVWPPDRLPDPLCHVHRHVWPAGWHPPFRMHFYVLVDTYVYAQVNNPAVCSALTANTPTQQPCTNPFAGPCVNFYYTIGEYSPCSVTCGGGIHTRSQNRVTATGQPAQPFNCAGLQPQADPQA